MRYSLELFSGLFVLVLCIVGAAATIGQVMPARAQDESSLLLASALHAPSEPMARFSLGVHRVTLEEPLKWSVSGAWESDAEDRVIWGDAVEDALRTFTLGGRRLPTTIAAISQKPSLLQRVGDTLIVESRDGIFDWLDSDFLPVQGRRSHLSLIKPAEEQVDNSQNPSLRSVYAWVTLGDKMLVFGDLKHGDGWTSALVGLDLERPDDFWVLREMDLDDPGRNMFLVGLCPFVATNDRVYVLWVTEGAPYLLGLPSDLSSIDLERPLAELTDRVSREVDIRFDNFSRPAAIFSSLEGMDMPVGLYSAPSSEQVRLLSRRPVDQGVGEGRETEWTLSALRIPGQSGGDDYIVPTTANHLTVVAGDKRWAFLEKGPVLGMGDQIIESMLIVPTAQID